MAQILGTKVGRIGYGLMGLTWRPDPLPQEQTFTAIKTALANGANFFNAGQLYGTPEHNSLHLLNEYFTEYPEDASKCSVCVKGYDPSRNPPINGSKESVRKSIDECLRVLDGRKKLDLWEMARIDPGTPIEDTIEAAAEYVKAGKLGGIALSEASAASIRRAAKIHKIEVVEVEFSLFATTILDNGVAEACAENNIVIVAYSPLAKGFLGGQFKTVDDIPENQRGWPQFQPGAFENNLKLGEQINQLAKRKGCTSSQVALAWILAKSGENGLPTIIPIPGSVNEARIVENSTIVELSAAEVKELDDIRKQFPVVGSRYPPAFQKFCFGDSSERTSS